ncbi:hypothetical protein CSIM01_13868 [Colletotrichum simmondsii]|uniref:Uncharacterized protein n=1 Tax=Colletotrichum simmondsii TaxID=703756 RepID=A0A135RXL8_9PEZI|nr:hypothetical protein CSIM01_13868 [Colletotrichum simmondsii]
MAQNPHNPEIQDLEVLSQSHDPTVNTAINSIVAHIVETQMQYDLDPTQTGEVLHGVHQAVLIYRRDLNERFGVAMDAPMEVDEDDVVGASGDVEPLIVPMLTEADFDLPVDVSPEVDRKVLATMAASLATELQETSIRVIQNRQQVVVSLASKAIKLADIVFRTFLVSLKQNLMLLIRHLRHLDVIVSDFECAEDSRNPELLRDLIRGINTIQHYAECSGPEAIKLNLVRIEVYDGYQRLLSLLDSDKESLSKSILLDTFNVLNGGPRRPGHNNETVALKILDGYLTLPPDSVSKLIKAAKLPWILASVLGRGSVMFLPANNSGNTTIIGYLPAIEQVLKIALKHDGGLLRELSEVLDKSIVEPFTSGLGLDIHQPTAQETRELEARSIAYIIGYARRLEAEDGSESSMDMRDRYSGYSEHGF